MSIVAELLTKPGVIAAGQYAYRGDRFSYKGRLSEDHARLLSIVCRATTMSTHMASDMLTGLQPDCRLHPTRGWMLRGPERSLCVLANTFCLLDTAQSSPKEILGLMRRALAAESMDLI